MRHLLLLRVWRRHHSSLRHLGQWSSAQPHVLWTPLGFRTPCCQNSFVVLLLQAVRRMYGDAGAFLTSSSPLGFCPIRFEHRSDVSECSEIEIRQRYQSPRWGAIGITIGITLQNRCCVYTNAFLKSSGPTRHAAFFFPRRFLDGFQAI